VRILRLLLTAAGLLVAAILVGPFLLPLPANPDRPAEAFAAPNGAFVEVDATRVYVETSGPPDRPAVVLVHGFGGSTYTWRHTAPLLAEAGYRVLAIDLRGFGLAGKAFEPDHDHAAQARIVLGAMDVAGVQRAVLVGHSMGGSVVAHTALAAPDRVAALVLVDAAITGPDAGVIAGGAADATVSLTGSLLELEPVRRTAQIAIRTLLGGGALEPILRSAYADPAFPTDDDVEAYGRAQQLAFWDLALLAIVRDGSRNALPAPIAELGSGPVLVAWGELDPWIPLPRGEELHAAIPGAAWLLVPGAGHLPMEEGRDGFEPGLLNFLEDLP
jgi:pimeloyl-ACP methyl ester carboxylesterase